MCKVNQGHCFFIQLKKVNFIGIKRFKKQKNILTRTNEQTVIFFELNTFCQRKKLAKLRNLQYLKSYHAPCPLTTFEFKQK